MHAVTLNPTTISLTSGGPPVTQQVNITNVPADFTVSQVLSVVVGTSAVDVGTTVTVDNPSPVVTATSASPVYTTVVSTPQQDPADNTHWTCQVTYTAV